MKPTIITQNIFLTLSGAPILRDISLHLSRGELVALIGANGAGKSSLLRVMLGLIEADSGSVTIDDTPLITLDPRTRAKKMAYAPQGAPVYWPMHARAVVTLGRIPHTTPWRRHSDDDNAAIDAAMRDTDTSHLAKRTVTTLSGGERARVMLARAIVADAPYLLADEPVASLDPYHQLHVMDILKQQATTGKGVLVVLHDLTLAMRYADRVLLLHQGRLLADGAPATVLNDENLATAFQISVSRWQDHGDVFLVPR